MVNNNNNNRQNGNKSKQVAIKSKIIKASNNKTIDLK